MTEEPYYLGFLANVDSNIKKLKLEYGFTIEEMSTTKYRNFTSSTDRTYNGLENVLYPQHGIVNKDGKIYYIKGLPKNLKGNRRYIIDLLSKLILFKEGYVSLPVQVGRAYISNEKLKKAEYVGYSLGINRREPIYNLSFEEIKRLNKFIYEIKLPFKQHYLQFALDNLEESIRIKKRELSFLTLMIGFESLFNLGKNQITHTISRHTALLMGKDKEESNQIYGEMKDFYKMRSKLIHANHKSKGSLTVNNNTITRLRNLLRDCIKKISTLELEKEILFKYLNERGFGDID